jgi:hypothetical protein
MPGLRDRIAADLKAARSNKTKVATAMGLSSTSVDRYFKWLESGELDDVQKRALAKGLSAVGLDPLKYMPEVPPEKRPNLPTSLLPLLDVFNDDKEILAALVQILTADDSERQVLKIVVEDRLKRR